MLRSMFAGVSGLRSHQTMMDVVGNNIANVNTHGYKSTRATFQDALYQATRGATEGDEAQGGINPMQIGLGSRVAAVDQNFSQGALQLTGRATDVAVQGEGFFMVRTGDGQDLYTRNGAFNWDNDGNLVDASGNRVLGDDEEPIRAEGLTDLRDISIGGDGAITGRDGDGDTEELGQIGLAMFANANGLERVGDNLFSESAASGAAVVDVPREDGRGALEGGTLEMSNVDLAEEFTGLIMAQRGFQANSRTITTSDEMLQELVNLKR